MEQSAFGPQQTQHAAEGDTQRLHGLSRESAADRPVCTRTRPKSRRNLGSKNACRCAERLAPSPQRFMDVGWALAMALDGADAGLTCSLLVLFLAFRAGTVKLTGVSRRLEQRRCRFEHPRDPRSMGLFRRLVGEALPKIAVENRGPNLKQKMGAAL
jgi:hypothetical protein